MLEQRRAASWQQMIRMMEEVHAETLRQCPWMTLRGKARLHESEFVEPGTFVVVPPGSTLLQLAPDAESLVFMNPQDVRALKEAQFGPLFSYVRFADDVAAVCLWISQQPPKGKEA